MKRLTALAALVLSIPITATAQSAASSASTAAIDEQVWHAISASVADQDINAMAATYHPDAVIVHAGGTLFARDQLPRWGKDMEAARAKGETATVEFRFSKRLDNAGTAFEIGMFKYTVIDSAGKPAPIHIPMEALLLRANGRWVIVMERQFAAAGPQEWDALKP